MRYPKLLCFLTAFLVSTVSVVSATELNIYSHRQPFLINPFLEAFTEKTGIKTNVVYSTKGLAQRLKAEGKNSPADVILTVDIGRLHIYQDMQLLAPIVSEKMMANIPSHLRSDDNTWFGLSKRSRIIVTAKDRVEPGAIKDIEDLADPRWAGKICVRPGSHVYNRALLASIIAALSALLAPSCSVLQRDFLFAPSCSAAIPLALRSSKWLVVRVMSPFTC